MALQLKIRNKKQMHIVFSFLREKDKKPCDVTMPLKFVTLTDLPNEFVIKRENLILYKNCKHKNIKLTE